MDYLRDRIHLQTLFSVVADRLTRACRDLPRSLCIDKTVYYLNGNDSTACDWTANDRMSEFAIFRNDNYRAAVAFVGKDRMVDCIIYGDDKDPQKITVKASFELPEHIDLRKAVEILAEAEDKYIIGPHADEWDKSTQETLENVRNVMMQDRTQRRNLM